MMKTGKLIAASSRGCSDILYASGFNCPDPFVWFEIDGRQTIIVSAMELDRARRESRKGVRVTEISEWSQEGGGGVEEALLGVVAKLPGTEWMVPASFPLIYADRLREEGHRLRCEKGAFIPERRRKNSGEVELLTEGLRIAEAAMEKLASRLGSARIGEDGTLSIDGELITSESLRREIAAECAWRGANCEQTIVACGTEGAEPHNIGHGLIMANQPIVVDIFPRVDASGYWGDLTRTFTKGKAPDIVKKAFEAVREARECAKEFVKPGIAAAETHKLAALIMEGHGFETILRGPRRYGFIHGLGHGVGLDIHEAPRVSAGVDEPLRDGDLITIEPGLYYPEWGGVRLEDMIWVRGDGNQCLTRIETFLEID